MRFPFFIMCLTILLSGLSCSKDGEDRDNIVLQKPIVVSTSITNEADNVVVGEQIITITFDQNIILSNANNIQLNGGTVKQASVAFKELRIYVDLLSATSYVLHIPTNNIKGPTGLGAVAVTLSFKTRGSTEQNITEQLVVPNPSSQAKNVYSFLRENYGAKVVSGTMANVSWNSHEAEWVYKHTGKYPALNCFDYVHLYASPANWIDYSNVQVAEDWWNANGLVAAMWHWNVPKRVGSTDDYTFYAKDTDFDLTKALISGTPEHTILQTDLDKLGNYLLLLKAKNIPVIWRPLHEAAGKWFWWGAKDAASYRALWIMMFETFADKGLNNLIWVWTSETNDDAWYPGDKYVDIVGCDLYNSASVNEIVVIHDKLKETYPNKIIALTEFGNVAAFETQWNSGATWSWVMPWYDYDRTVSTSGIVFDDTSHKHANIMYWKALFASDKAISRDQMPDLK